MGGDGEYTMSREEGQARGARGVSSKSDSVRLAQAEGLIHSHGMPRGAVPEINQHVLRIWGHHQNKISSAKDSLSVSVVVGRQVLQATENGSDSISLSKDVRKSHREKLQYR